MAEFKLVLNRKDGKSFQKVVKDKEAEFFLKKRMGQKVDGKDIGMEGYELLISGGSDNCGFPMRKGIQERRKWINVTGSTIGFCGKDRNKNKQPGLRTKKTVCGELVDSKIVQINLRVLKEGKEKLGEEQKAEEAKK
ncbi:MAG: S6e family ribosomal protein [Candidatus Woesearchaeota archaeon]